MHNHKNVVENPLRSPLKGGAIQMRSNPLHVGKKADENDFGITMEAEGAAKVKDEDRPNAIHVIIELAEREELNGLYQLLSYKERISTAQVPHVKGFLYFQNAYGAVLSMQTIAGANGWVIGYQSKLIMGSNGRVNATKMDPEGPTASHKQTETIVFGKYEAWSFRESV